MAKPFKTWTVLPHGGLEQLEENVWTVVGDMPMPLGHFPRRMTIVRLRDGCLVVYSAIALHEHEMTQIETFGKPAYLVVPSDIHRQDARIWKKRYPDMRVLAPSGARHKVEQVVKVDEAAWDDPDVVLVEVPGLDGHELALEVRNEDGTTLIVNDLIGNLAKRKGLFGWFIGLMGFAGDHAQIPRVVKSRAMKDAQALAVQLESWAQRDIRRIVMSHGDPIDAQPGATLRNLARNITHARV